MKAIFGRAWAWFGTREAVVWSAGFAVGVGFVILGCLLLFAFLL